MLCVVADAGDVDGVARRLGLMQAPMLANQCFADTCDAAKQLLMVGRREDEDRVTCRRDQKRKRKWETIEQNKMARLNDRLIRMRPKERPGSMDRGRVQGGVTVRTYSFPARRLTRWTPGGWI